MKKSLLIFAILSFNIIKSAELNSEIDVNQKDADGNTPLMLAVINDDEAQVELLLNASADLDIQDNKGETALTKAAWANNFDLVKLLLQARANPNIQDQGKYTAIRWAIINKNQDLVTLLLNSKAKADIPDNDGITAKNEAEGSKSNPGLNSAMSDFELAQQTKEILGTKILPENLKMFPAGLIKLICEYY